MVCYEEGVYADTLRCDSNFHGPGRYSVGPLITSQVGQ